MHARLLSVAITCLALVPCAGALVPTIPTAGAQSSCAVIDHLEFTQAVQHDPYAAAGIPPGAPAVPDDQVPLIDGRPLTIRAYVRPVPGGGANPCDVSAQLQIFEGYRPRGSGKAMNTITPHDPPWDRGQETETVNFRLAIRPSGTVGSDGRDLTFKVCLFAAPATDCQQSEQWYTVTRKFMRRAVPAIIGVPVEVQNDGGPANRGALQYPSADRVIRAVYPIRELPHAYGFVDHELELNTSFTELVSNGTFESLDHWTDRSTFQGVISLTPDNRLELWASGQGEQAVAEQVIEIPSELLGEPLVLSYAECEWPLPLVELSYYSDLNAHPFIKAERWLSPILVYPMRSPIYLRFIGREVQGLHTAYVDNVSLGALPTQTGLLRKLRDYRQVLRKDGYEADAVYGWVRRSAMSQFGLDPGGGVSNYGVAFGTDEGNHEDTEFLVFAHEVAHTSGAGDLLQYGGTPNPRYIGDRDGKTHEYGWDVDNLVRKGHAKVDTLLNIMAVHTQTAMDEFWISAELYESEEVPGSGKDGTGQGGTSTDRFHVWPLDEYTTALSPQEGYAAAGAPDGGDPLPVRCLWVPINGGPGWSLAHAFALDMDSESSNGPEPGDGELRALDAGGVTVFSALFGSESGCAECGAIDALPDICVPADLPVEAVQLYRQGEMVDVMTRTLHAPTIEIVSPQPGATLDSTTVIEWQASDADGDVLRVHVAYSHDGATWIPLATRSAATSVAFPALALASSEVGMIAVAVSDGMNTTTVIVDNLRLGPNRAPRVRISSPKDSTQYRRGEFVMLLGAAFDLEDGELDESITWYSNIDGYLGSGAMLTVIGPAPGNGTPVAFTPGSHLIVMRATDGDGAIAADSVTIVIEP